MKPSRKLEINHVENMILSINWAKLGIPQIDVFFYFFILLHFIYTIIRTANCQPIKSLKKSYVSFFFFHCNTIFFYFTFKLYKLY